MDKYYYCAVNDHKHSENFYNLDEVLECAKKDCLAKQSDVEIWVMPSNQFRPNAFVFVYWQLYGVFNYNDGVPTFIKK